MSPPKRKKPSESRRLFRGLVPEFETEFPKTCTRCKKVFPDFASFMASTHQLSHSTGLAEYQVRGKHVALFRNCDCGTTILVYCKDRRGQAPRAQTHREQFDEMVRLLKAQGMSDATARRITRQQLGNG